MNFYPAESAIATGAARELYLLEGDGQHEDGGWTITWPPLSPACELEWRGWVTLHGNRMPPRWLLLPISLLTMAGVYFTFQTFLGREAGVAMLMLLSALKLLEMRETEPRSARGVDFHHAADAERIRICARGFRLRRNRRFFRNGCGDLDVLARWDWSGASGRRKPPGLRGAHRVGSSQIKAGGSREKPYGRDDNSRHNTRQHQT